MLGIIFRLLVVAQVVLVPNAGMVLVETGPLIGQHLDIEVENTFAVRFGLYEETTFPIKQVILNLTYNTEFLVFQTVVDHRVNGGTLDYTKVNTGFGIERLQLTYTANSADLLLTTDVLATIVFKGIKANKDHGLGLNGSVVAKNVYSHVLEADVIHLDAVDIHSEELFWLLKYGEPL